ncbi:MAG: GIY-YIG nuclease family protein [Chloroflexi bacterium]|nr:GIY-YIG nuclease family protein [Chloroflexota bacterium]
MRSCFFTGTYDEYWAIPANSELKKYGMAGFTGEKRSSLLWFDLAQTDFHKDWKGKLIVSWPPPERSWWRRAHRPANEMSILAILEDTAFERATPEWDAVNLTWDELRILPTRLKNALLHTRGVYYIFDTSDGKGYVGSAYGKDNLLGRWLNYAVSGDGGNRLLRQRDPHQFRFTILQRVSPDMEDKDLIRLENSWKQRLHTRKPDGLNDN